VNRDKPTTPWAEFDPIRPIIAPASAAKKLFVRAYAEPRQQWRHRQRTAIKEAKRTRPALSASAVFNGTIFVFDTETIRHELSFGAFEEWRRRKLVSRAVFYADALPVEQPRAFERLRRICQNLDVRLVSLESVFQQHIWPLRDRGGTLICFNAPYDLSRIADGWHSATKTDRKGTSYCNGVSLTHSFETYNAATGDAESVSPVFVRIKRDDRHHVRYDFKHGRVLDLATLAFALTDCNHSLASACAAFGVSFEDRPGAHSGEIAGENVAGCLYDVAKSSELLWALAKEYERHPIALGPHKAQSGAAVAKAYLDAFGVQPRMRVQQLFPKTYLGFAAQAYFGGRVECRIVHIPVPCVYLDFASMYPTVFSLLNLWFDQVIPATLELEEVDPEEVQTLLNAVARDPSLLFEKSLWRQLAFFAQVDPNGAILPARVEVPTPFAKSLRNIVVGPVESSKPLWYVGPDLAGALIAGAHVPRILRAWKLKPTGLQASLRPLDFRGEVRIDPRTDDFFRILIEQRRRTTDNPLDDKLRNTGFKVVANSGAYGDFAETNPIDIDPDEEPIARPVSVYGDRDFTTYVNRPENPGRFCFFPTASLVTAAARLLLGLAFHEVARRGGEVAYCDTDSVVIVASREPSLVPCQGGPYRLADGTRAVLALSWEQVEEIQARFETLNPYRAGSASLLKLEEQNLEEDGLRSDLWFYGVSEKVYALFSLGESSEPAIRKYSAHALGQYQSPIAGDCSRRWIEEAWKRRICAGFGQPVHPFEWESLPALAQLTLSTWSVMKPYLENPNIRPFDFLLVASPTRSFVDFAKGYVACCREPRPSSFLFNDPAKWVDQDWRCLRCAAAIPVRLFRKYESVLRGTLDSFEVKRLCADGNEPRPSSMRGLTVPRPVRVASVTPIGKEVIVDPTDTDEGLTAEMLSETDVIEYVDPSLELDALRLNIRDVGVRAVSRKANRSRRHVQEFVNGQSTPHPKTIGKLKEAVKALQRAGGPSGREPRGGVLVTG
jgi:hypothetical protein